MKEISLILFISLFFGTIISICRREYKDEIYDFSLPEECFTNDISEKEISKSDSIEDYKCCYYRSYENMKGRCVLVEKSEIPTIGSSFFVFACSENELPDESKSDSCMYSYPLKKSNCFSRSVSQEEKDIGSYNYNFDICCYQKFDNIERCAPMDSNKFEEYQTELLNNLKAYYNPNVSLEIICGDSTINTKEDSNNSSKDSINLNEESSDSVEKSIDSVEKSIDSVEKSIDSVEKSINSIEESSDSVVKNLKTSDKYIYIIWLIIIFF